MEDKICNEIVFIRKQFLVAGGQYNESKNEIKQLQKNKNTTDRHIKLLEDKIENLKNKSTAIEMQITITEKKTELLKDKAYNLKELYKKLKTFNLDNN